MHIVHVVFLLLLATAHCATLTYNGQQGLNLWSNISNWQEQGRNVPYNALPETGDSVVLFFSCQSGRPLGRAVTIGPVTTTAPAAAKMAFLQVDSAVEISQLTIESDVDEGTCSTTLEVAAPLVVTTEVIVDQLSTLVMFFSSVETETLMLFQSTVVGSGVITATEGVTAEGASIEPGFNAELSPSAAYCNPGQPSRNYLGDLIFQTPAMTMAPATISIRFEDPSIPTPLSPVWRPRNVSSDTVTITGTAVFDEKSPSLIRVFYNTEANVVNQGPLVSWKDVQNPAGVSLKSFKKLRAYSFPCPYPIPTVGPTKKPNVVPPVPQLCSSTSLSVVIGGATCPEAPQPSVETSQLATSSGSDAAASTSVDVDATVQTLPTSTLPTTAAPSSLSTGAIVGIAVGSAVAVGIIIAVVLATPSLIQNYKTQQALAAIPAKLAKAQSVVD